MDNFSADDSLMNSWDAGLHQEQQRSLSSSQEQQHQIEENTYYEDFPMHLGAAEILPEIPLHSPKRTDERVPSEENASSEISFDVSLNETECRVCKSLIANRHNYYGCIGVCVSCRGFFRRSVQVNISFYSQIRHSTLDT